MYDTVSERLRRLIRNQLLSNSQVRVLSVSVFFCLITRSASRPSPPLFLSIIWLNTGLRLFLSEKNPRPLRIFFEAAQQHLTRLVLFWKFWNGGFFVFRIKNPNTLYSNLLAQTHLVTYFFKNHFVSPTLPKVELSQKAHKHRARENSQWQVTSRECAFTRR